LSGDGGSLLIEFSERVLPPLNYSAGTDLLNSMQGLAQSLHLEYLDSGQPRTDDGAKVYEENLPGMRFGAVVRFLPQFPIPTTLTVEILADQLEDEWGNGNLNQSIVIDSYDSTPGAVLYVDDDAADTSPTRLARSSVGSPFLFHGQYYDYDTGLYYFRARHYNPYEALFLQRDPVAYGDSPNLYTAFGHHPATFRDPDGRILRILTGAGKGTKAGKTPKRPKAPKASILQRVKGFFSRGGGKGKLHGNTQAAQAVGDGSATPAPVAPNGQIRGAMQPAGNNTPRAVGSTKATDPTRSAGQPSPGGRAVPQGSRAGPTPARSPSKQNGRTPAEAANAAPGRPASTAQNTSDPNYRPHAKQSGVVRRSDPDGKLDESRVAPGAQPARADWQKGMKRSEPSKPGKPGDAVKRISKETAAEAGKARVVKPEQRGGNATPFKNR
jgi:RHS repeat-associated protein